jgi:uncharacterized membrane protein YbhN (UPF0104 family)
VIAVGVSIAVIGVVFAYLLPKIANYGQAWDVARTLSPGWILVLVAVTLVNILANAPPWMAALPALGFRNALRVALASGALSVLALGGAALGVATQLRMLRSWGLDGSSVALATALTNIWGQLVSYAFPVVAVAALSAEGGRNKTLELVALIGLVGVAAILSLFGIGLSSPRLAQRIGDAAAGVATSLKRLMHRNPARWSGDAFVGFRAEAVQLLRRRWPALTVTTLANQLAVFVVLFVTLRAVGIPGSEVTPIEAFAAWSIIRTLGKIPITAGGFGVEEIALTGALIGFGAHNAQAVSATLIYRFLTVVPNVALGLAAAATYRAGRKPQAASATKDGRAWR